ncbi:MAG: flagellar export chaperone FliS [Nitrospinota bacterium]|nr:flagellar export chaperone FliS [Nitrospinota bacterium]
MSYRHLQTYKVNEVSTAGKMKLVLMMYDGAIRFLNECKKKMRENDIAGRGLYLSKAQKIVGELQESLNRQKGGEVASSLEKAYHLITIKLTQANINGDIAMVDQSISLLNDIREAWLKISSDPKLNLKDKNNASSRVAINL